MDIFIVHIINQFTYSLNVLSGTFIRILTVNFINNHYSSIVTMKFEAALRGVLEKYAILLADEDVLGWKPEGSHAVTKEDTIFIEKVNELFSALQANNVGFGRVDTLRGMQACVVSLPAPNLQFLYDQANGNEPLNIKNINPKVRKEYASARTYKSHSRSRTYPPERNGIIRLGIVHDCIMSSIGEVAILFEPGLEIPKHKKSEDGLWKKGPSYDKQNESEHGILCPSRDDEGFYSSFFFIPKNISLGNDDNYMRGRLSPNSFNKLNNIPSSIESVSMYCSFTGMAGKEVRQRFFLEHMKEGHLSAFFQHMQYDGLDKLVD